MGLPPPLPPSPVSSSSSARVVSGHSDRPALRNSVDSANLVAKSTASASESAMATAMTTATATATATEISSSSRFKLNKLDALARFAAGPSKARTLDLKKSDANQGEEAATWAKEEEGEINADDVSPAGVVEDGAESGVVHVCGIPGDVNAEMGDGEVGDGVSGRGVVGVAGESNADVDVDDVINGNRGGHGDWKRGEADTDKDDTSAAETCSFSSCSSYSDNDDGEGEGKDKGEDKKEQDPAGRVLLPPRFVCPDGTYDTYAYHRGTAGREPRRADTGDLLCPLVLSPEEEEEVGEVETQETPKRGGGGEGRRDTNHGWDSPELRVRVTISFPLEDVDEEEDGEADDGVDDDDNEKNIDSNKSENNDADGKAMLAGESIVLARRESGEGGGGANGDDGESSGIDIGIGGGGAGMTRQERPKRRRPPSRAASSISVNSSSTADSAPKRRRMRRGGGLQEASARPSEREAEERSIGEMMRVPRRFESSTMWDLADPTHLTPMVFATETAAEYGLSFGATIDLARSIQAQLDDHAFQNVGYYPPIVDQDPFGTDRREYLVSVGAIVDDEGRRDGTAGLESVLPDRVAGMGAVVRLHGGASAPIHVPPPHLASDGSGGGRGAFRPAPPKRRFPKRQFGGGGGGGGGGGASSCASGSAKRSAKNLADDPVSPHLLPSHSDYDKGEFPSPIVVYRDEVLLRARKECTEWVKERSLSIREDGRVGVLEHVNGVVCHICHHRKDNCVVFQCGRSQHIYCDSHCKVSCSLWHHCHLDQ